MTEPIGGYKDHGGYSSRLSPSYYAGYSPLRWLESKCKCKPCRKVRKWTILRKH